MALKLHRQFGHPSQEKLLNLIKNAGITDGDLKLEIIKVSETCDICMKHRKPMPRPVVSLPLATKFNSTVAMDLKKWNKVYFLVLVDVATRYTQARVVVNKTPSSIIKAIFICWISIFGAPREFLSDNGGEFSNPEMRELGNMYNIRCLCTAAESPFSNGICERSNAIIGDSVSKIVEDVSQCDLETALAWAVSARNCLYNNQGFSSNQLVFGTNPVFPNVCINSPPGNEPPSDSIVVAKNLEAMHKARESYIRAESSERIKRALRHNVRQSVIEDLECGASVYYKRNEDTKWRGPAKVLGIDGKQVIVKHGGICIRVHTCRLQRGRDSENCDPVVDNSEETPCKLEDGLALPPIHEEEHGAVSCKENNASAVEAVNETADEEHTDADVNHGEGKSIRPKPGMKFEGIRNSTGEYFSGKIISRAGKSTGKYKDWYNVKADADGSVSCVEFNDELIEWKELAEEIEVLVCQ